MDFLVLFLFLFFILVSTWLLIDFICCIFLKHISLNVLTGLGGTKWMDMYIVQKKNLKY